MNIWAAWGPTIVAVIAMLVTLGRYSQIQNTHEKRLDDQDDRLDANDVRVEAKFDDHGKHLQRVDIALVKLEQYNRGFADATQLAKHNKGQV